jgi:hypothetical protein
MESSSKGSQVEFADYIPIKIGYAKNEAIRLIKELGDNFKVDTSNRIISNDYNKIDSNFPQVDEPVQCRLAFHYNSLDLVDLCKIEYVFKESISTMVLRKKRAVKAYFIKRYCEPVIKMIEQNYIGRVLKGDGAEDEWIEEMKYLKESPNYEDSNYVYHVINTAAAHIDTCKNLSLSVELKKYKNFSPR